VHCKDDLKSAGVQLHSRKPYSSEIYPTPERLALTVYPNYENYETKSVEIQDKPNLKTH